MKKEAFLTTLFVAVALFLPLAGCSHSSSSGSDSGSGSGGGTKFSYDDPIIGAWISSDGVTFNFDMEGNYTSQEGESSESKTGTYEKDTESGNYVLKGDDGNFVFEISDDGTSAILYETDESGAKKGDGTEFTIDISCCTVPQAAKYIKTLTEDETYAIIVKDDFTTSYGGFYSALKSLSSTESTGPYVSLDLTETKLSIGNSAFAGTSYSNPGYALREVKLPKNCTSIGIYAFIYQAGLQNVVLPETLESIGYEAFYYCYSLKTLTKDGSNTLPKSLKTMGSCAFDCCTSLETIDLSKTQLKEIPEGAFYMNSSSALTTVYLPETIETIGKSAFECCVSLSSIIIPQKTTSIGYYAFHNCISLTSLTIEKEEGKAWGYASNTYSSESNPSAETLVMIPCFEKNAAYFFTNNSGTLQCTDECCGEEECACKGLTYGYQYWWYKVSYPE